MFVDKSPTNELVDNTFTVLSKIFSSISSFTVLSKTSLIASVSLGFTKLVKDVVKKPNNTAIIDVIKNIIIDIYILTIKEGYQTGFGII